MHKLH